MSRIASKLTVVAGLGLAGIPHVAAAQTVVVDGPRPYAMAIDDGFAVDPGAPRPVRRPPQGPDGVYRPNPIPPRVVYDERRREAGARGRPDPSVWPADLDRPAGDGLPPAPPRRRFDAAFVYGVDPMPIGPVPVRYGDGALPDASCTIQRSESITPAGWRRIVTHRTCYRR